MTYRTLLGDNRATLATLPACSVQCAVTSPPYYGLRDYGNAAQIGLEPSPDAYVAALVDVFRAVRRVLRDDGTCWLNVGDSYAANRPYQVPGGKYRDVGNSMASTVPDGLKPGDLIGIPWRLAFALQADGWIVRSDVIWHKPAAMPESQQGWRWERCRVKVQPGGRGGGGTARMMANETPANVGCADLAEWTPCPGCPKCAPNDGFILRRGSWRPTRAHEYVFLLAKSDRYFCDGEAVREDAAQPVGEPRRTGQGKAESLAASSPLMTRQTGTLGTNQGPATRNIRSVWSINPRPSGLHHFAMMAPDLAATCIKAGTSERGCCPACGSVWVRVVERESPPDFGRGSQGWAGGAGVGSPQRNSNGPPGNGLGAVSPRHLGWRPTCSCPPAVPVPCTVLDPFGGAGTTAAVAEYLGRDSILCELSPDYAELVPRRVAEVARSFGRRDVVPGQERLFGGAA